MYTVQSDMSCCRQHLHTQDALLRTLVVFMPKHQNKQLSTTLHEQDTVGELILCMAPHTCNVTLPAIGGAHCIIPVVASSADGPHFR